MTKGQHHIVTSEDYQRYLEDKMTPKERHDFEQVLLNREFESDAFEGLSQLTPEELSEDLKHLKTSLDSKTKRSFTFPFLRIAAAFMLLSVFSFLVYYSIESNTSNEIAQSKSIPAVEKADKEQASELTTHDSTMKEQERIVAYSKKSEEKPIEKPKAKSSMRQSQGLAKEETIENEVLEIQENEIVEIADDEKLEEILLDQEELGFTELPALAEMEGVEPMEIEVEPVEQKKERFLEKAAAPAAVMKRSADSKQKQYKAITEEIRTITGNVRSVEDDEAIPGVNIVVKGTSVGTVSDIEGNYSIDVPNDEELTLVFAYIGFITEEIEVGNQEAIDINIEPDLTSLSEIVVTGYATQSRKNITGAVSTVTMDDLENASYQYDPPKPVGGSGKFKDYVEENMRYPDSGLEEKIKGTVKLKFTVERNGKLSNIEVLKSMGEDFDKEAIRLLTNGPKWEPAKEKDVAVAKEVKVKIRFRP